MGRGQPKLPSRLELSVGLTILSCKKRLTETCKRNSTDPSYQGSLRHKGAGMTDTNESHKEASSVKTSLLDAKTKLQIGAWNVRTMFDTAKTVQIIQVIHP